MMRDLLLLQLVFNLLILVSLMVLARTRPGGKKRPKKAGSKPRTKVPASLPAQQHSAVPAPLGLEALIEQAERKELIAEAALRQRLERFRARAAG